MKKLSPFLEKLKELIIDEKSYHLIGYWGMKKKVKNWPTIKYKDGGYAPDDKKNDTELREETLDLENFEPLYLDKDKFIFYAGGDWQYPYTVTIKLKDGKLTVTDSHPYKKGEYKGISNKDMIHILQIEDLQEKIKDEKAKVEAEELIKKTKDSWTSKDINFIIEEIKNSTDYKIRDWTLVKKHLKDLIEKELKISVIKEKLSKLTGKKVVLKEELPKDDTEEGKLLIAALAKITTESQTDKTPDEVFSQVVNLKTQIYNVSSNNVDKKSVVGIVLKDNCVLLGEAVTDDDRNGWLCFPGGGVDEGESLLRAVKREVREEVNVLAYFEEQSPITDPTKPNVFFFKGKYINGDIQHNNEFKNMNWYDLNNLPVENIYPQNIEILNKIKIDLLSSNNKAMDDRIFIIKEGCGYKQGEVIKNYIQTEKGILINNQHIPRENYFFLNEKLSSSDEEEVKKIVKTIIQKMFWRLYTRSSFLVTE